MQTTLQQKSNHRNLLQGVLLLFVACRFSSVVAKPTREPMEEKGDSSICRVIFGLFDTTRGYHRFVIPMAKTAVFLAFLFLLPAIISGPPLFCYGAICEWKDHFDLWPRLILPGGDDVFTRIPNEPCACAALQGGRQHGFLAFWRHFLAAWDFERLLERDFAYEMAQEGFLEVFK